MDKDRTIALFSLKDRLEAWLRDGEALLQIIDSLIPPDNSKPLTFEQMRKETRNIVFGKDDAKKVSGRLA